MTMIHGDFWSNNMMFAHDNEGNPTDIKLIDFQMMGRGHPALDICYLLHINTDSEFRSKHLETVLREYYQVFSTYLDKDLNMNFKIFEKEFQERRQYGLVLGLLVSDEYHTLAQCMLKTNYNLTLQVMPNVTSPNHREFKTLADWKELNTKRHEEIAGPDADDIHPGIKEMRRKIVGMVHEYEKVF